MAEKRVGKRVAPRVGGGSVCLCCCVSAVLRSGSLKIRTRTNWKRQSPWRDAGLQASPENLGVFQSEWTELDRSVLSCILWHAEHLRRAGRATVTSWRIQVQHLIHREKTGRRCVGQKELGGEGLGGGESMEHMKGIPAETSACAAALVHEECGVFGNVHLVL